MKPIFIIGGSRTGSELLKNILRKYSDVDMLGEACLLCPRWLHRDFCVAAKASAGGLGSGCDVGKLLDLMYSGRLFGHFWLTIDRLDRELVGRCIRQSDKSLQSILLCLMQLHAAANHKTRIGAKFPVHYSHAERLLEWFPDCKLVHTTRDPRAVYVSQSRKYRSEGYTALRNTWVSLQHLVHINIQSVWTSRIHQKLREHENYFLSRYEDLVLEPEKHLKRLCAFLEIEFHEEMARPKVFSNSSFANMKGRGRELQASSAVSWKSRINHLELGLIGLVSGRAMARLGYSSEASATR